MHPRPALLVAHRSQLAALGEVFKSCEPVRLTEEDTEYSVFAIKHVYDAHVVVQFNCTNTIQEQVLEGVTVAMDLAEAVSGGRSVRGARTESCCDLQICWGGHQLRVFLFLLLLLFVAADGAWMESRKRGACQHVSMGHTHLFSTCLCSPVLPPPLVW